MALSKIVSLIFLVINQSTLSLSFPHATWFNKAKKAAHRFFDDVDISFSSNTDTFMNPEFDSDTDRIRNSYSFSIFTNDIRPHLEITESSPLYLIVQSPTESPSDTPQTTFSALQLLPSDRIDEDTLQYTLHSEYLNIPWDEHTLYLCDNPLCSNDDGLEMEVNRDNVQNMQLIPRDVSDSDFSNFESGYSWNLDAIFDRLLSVFDGFQGDFYRPFQDDMTYMAPEYEYGVDSFMVIETAARTTEYLDDIATTESTTPEAIVISNEEFNAVQEHSLEIEDLNQVLADKGSTESENSLLLQQMTVIIIFIMFCGTMYVLWRYWLEKRALDRDLDYYRLSPDM